MCFVETESISFSVSTALPVLLLPGTFESRVYSGDIPPPPTLTVTAEGFHGHFYLISGIFSQVQSYGGRRQA